VSKQLDSNFVELRLVGKTTKRFVTSLREISNQERRIKIHEERSDLSIKKNRQNLESKKCN
jgi:hypothetical protein